MRTPTCIAIGIGLLLASPSTGAADSEPPAVRITIIADAFGARDGLRRDWGFAALVEYDGRRILFDTGNDAASFAHNADALGVDLTRLDFVVVSHRHGDHTDGLHHLRKVNSGIRVYAPDDEHFGGDTPPALYRRPVESLPDSMRYFAGDPPARVPHGTPWRGFELVLVTETREIAPGVRLIVAGDSQRGAGIPEIALALDTPEGQVIIVGCAHPGVEQILAAAGADSSRVRLLAGGFHLAPVPDDRIVALAGALRGRWRIEAVAPGHCTSEPGFAALQAAFGPRYRYAGLGTVIEL
jgi:7,8-dihydropterin-6-yl-methyl-4-(beta-D-ribofuranosyl)aminobenzene 5'-phosphate synthase